jgi:dTDP-L-rhamnose 4-epimerase
VKPIATSEEAVANNNSVYALSKNVQENLLMMVGKMYNLPVVALRCFNVYGPRQSLSNPYTGVSAIFISRLKNNNPPVVYEDGLQTRDFVSVHDVVEALVKSMESKYANWQVINIGSGKPISIKEVAVTLAGLLHRSVPPLISGKWRKGDVRHCFADIHLAKKLLRWEPKMTLEKGFTELIAWSEKQQALDLFEQAEKELRNKSLL